MKGGFTMTFQIFDLAMIFGLENVFWYHLPIDQVEWTDPKYYHQN